MKATGKFILQRWEEFYACDGEHVCIPDAEIARGTLKQMLRALRKACDLDDGLISIGDTFVCGGDEQFTYYLSVERRD